jgi:hypothetical protein
MLQEISYYPVLERPLILYLGILTLLSLLATATIAVLNVNGVRTIPVRWHRFCAGFTVLLALVHGGLGLLAYL